jgi:ABC-type branched-subunit amino acid transport system substrate-binding protein
MFNLKFDRRRLVTLATVALLAACKAVPGGNVPPPPPAPVLPNANVLPTDTMRHRIALLVPLTGPNGAAGQAIANASTMALLDTNAQNLRITTYDTSAGAAAAAAKAIADGNKLILGPLMSEDIPVVAAAARPARVPVISYSNDEMRAARDTLIMGSLPSESVARTVAYARSQGVTRFGALIPVGEYGQRSSAALVSAVRAHGGTLTAMESYDRSLTAIAQAARRLRDKGGFDAVLIADGGRMSAQAGPVLKAVGNNGVRLLGSELWSGEGLVTATPALAGAWYSAISDSRWRQFTDSYRNRFGTPPYRIATLGYDSVLLTLRVAREWKPGTVFPTTRLFDPDGFLGLDGAFRFRSNGAIQRALEVRQVRVGGVDVVSAAPGSFTN